MWSYRTTPTQLSTRRRQLRADAYFSKNVIGKRSPVVVPNRPRASSWTTDMMRDGDVLIDHIANGARVTS